MLGPPAPINADHGGVAARVRVGAGLGETDAEANRYHEPASPSKPATAAELAGGAGNPPIASTATSAAAATFTRPPCH